MKGKTEVVKEIAKKHGSRDLIVILGGGGVVKNQETTMSIAESNGKHGVITLSVDSCVFDPLSKASKEIPIVHNKTAEAFSEELMNSLHSVASKREIKNPFKEEDGCQLSSRYAGSLISGKEAFNAVLDGKEVEWLDNDQWSMFTMSTAWAPSELSSGKYKFRVKPVVASVMTFDEWYKEENWGPAFGDNGDFHYGASVVWDYKQSEIDALQKRIDDSIALLQGKSIGEVYKAIRILKGDKND